MYLQYRENFIKEYTIFGNKQKEVSESLTTTYENYDFDMEF